jgi:hypothetical protein
MILFQVIDISFARGVRIPKSWQYHCYMKQTVLMFFCIVVVFVDEMYFLHALEQVNCKNRLVAFLL